MFIQKSEMAFAVAQSITGFEIIGIKTAETKWRNIQTHESSFNLIVAPNQFSRWSMSFFLQKFVLRNLVGAVRINPRLERRHSGLEAIGSAITCQQKTKEFDLMSKQKPKLTHSNHYLRRSC